MSAKDIAPGTPEDRFAAYTQSLAQAAGHLDRHEPLKAYCKGLLLPIERKSVEPMAARLAPDNVRQMHQSMHHLVADAPWKDEDLLKKVREYAFPAMTQQSTVEAWVIDDTGFPKKGKHSVGVGHQYCGQLGKSDNCQVAVSLSVARGIPVCLWHGSCIFRKTGRKIESGATRPGFRKTFTLKRSQRWP